MTNLFFQIVIGLGVTALGFYQIYAARRYFKHLKTNGNAATSSFAAMALWSGFIFGVLLIFGGLQFLFGMYN